MRNERGAFLGFCRKNFSQCPLLTFLTSSGRSRERLKIKTFEKIFIPSLGRQREGKKLTPLGNFLFWLRFGTIFIYRTARSSEMEPFFAYGIKSDAIKISACLFSEADAISFPVFSYKSDRSGQSLRLGCGCLLTALHRETAD